jgi:hypothetical protein
LPQASVTERPIALPPDYAGEQYGSAKSSKSSIASLTKTDFELVRPHLKPIRLAREAVLFGTGDSVKQVYFPHSGIVSLVIDLASGDMVEAAMIGRWALWTIP